jgi:ribulose-phosphate 3-epimerase
LRAVEVVASALAADPTRLGLELEAAEHAGADRVQWDIMDGHFVPNFTFGPHVVAAARQVSRLPFEAHLMVEEPGELLGAFVDAGCERLIVHAEACRQLHRVLGRIGELGAKAGVALNPATPVSAVRHVLDLVDLVLVMTVNPGFGGQSYLSSMEEKIGEAARLVTERGLEIQIEVDGGIAPETAPGVVRSGARALVAGTAVFGAAGGPAVGVRALREAARKGLVGA